VAGIGGKIGSLRRGNGCGKGLKLIGGFVVDIYKWSGNLVLFLTRLSSFRGAVASDTIDHKDRYALPSILQRKHMNAHPLLYNQAHSFKA